MRAQLLSQTNDPTVIARALRMCTGKTDQCDSEFNDLGGSDEALIRHWAIKQGHGSTLEHASFTFEISDISRALLQEIARHRISSLSVRSTRYTLKEIAADEELGRAEEIFTEADKIFEVFDRYCVMPVPTNNEIFEDRMKSTAVASLCMLHDAMVDGAKNDEAKYMLPECFKTQLIWTLNVRSLRNMFELRTAKGALPEFRQLTKAMFDEIPDQWKFLVEDTMTK